MSSSVLSRIQKRRNRVVTVDGEAVHVRSLSYAEVAAMDDLQSPSDRLFYMIGCGLLDDDGTPALPRKPGESAADYVARVRDALPHLSVDAASALAAEIHKSTKEPSIDATVKNSDPTDSQGS